MHRRIASAPLFRYPPPDKALLEELVVGYTHITGDPVRRPKKRNLVATCYRVHGDDFLPLVLRLFVRNGTASNLLGEIRCLAPSQITWPPEGGSMDETGGQAPPASEAVPGLIYSAENGLGSDPTSKPRHDRHVSNDEAEALAVEDDYPRSAWDPLGDEPEATELG
jgi:hypothetical protein